MSVEKNLKVLMHAVQTAAEQASRAKEEIHLVAVSKGCSVDQIKEAYWAGCRDFAESRVQEALEKMETTPADIRWHFIGKLQKNKVNKVVGRFVLIHSVDSLELAERISWVSEKQGIKSGVLLEVNTSGEETKSGLTPGQWEGSFEKVLSLEGIRIHGLMTMAPLTEDEGVIRHCFSTLRLLRDKLQGTAGNQAELSTLSMGMTNDYPLAILEGATLIRIGTAIFHETC